MPPQAQVFLKNFEGVFLGRKRRHAGGEDTGNVVKQHPDLQRSIAFEKDHTRFEIVEDIGDKLLHRHLKQRRIEKKKGGEEEEATSAAKRDGPYSGDRGADTSKEHMEEYVRIGRSTEAVYSEPEPVVALEVFRATMQRIEDHTDPFATIGSSGETRHKLESHPKTYQDFVTKKCALTELLRLFWSAVRDKNRPKCGNLAQRVEDFDKGLSVWRQQLPSAEALRAVEPFLSTMREQAGAVRARWKRMEEAARAAQARRDKRK